MPDGKKLAALYVRVSTKEQEEGLSLEVQDEDLRAYAEREGMEVVAAYRDVAPGDPGRAGLEEAIRAAGSYDVLLVWDFSRLSRDMAGTYATWARLHDAGAHAISIRDGTRSTDLLPAGMHALINAYERQQIAARTSAARRKMARRGEWPTGPAPFGTSAPRESPRVLTLDEDEAAWIRRAAEKVLAGMTTGQVAKWLESQGAPRPTRDRGKKWTYAAVHQLLRSPRLHQGFVEWRGEEIDHPRILDEATWTRLKAELDSRNPGGQRRPKRYPLTGHVLCTCGAIWRSWGSYNGPPGSRWYGCSKRDIGPASECDWSGPRKAIEANRLEELVWGALLSLVDVGAFEERYAEAGPDPSDELVRAGETAEVLRAELKNLYRRDARSEGAMADAVREAEDELADAQAEVARLASLNRDRETALAAVEAARSALLRMKGQDPVELSRVLDDLDVRVHLQHPKEGADLAWVIEARLLVDPPEEAHISFGDLPSDLGSGRAYFEKEMAELESADQQTQ